MLSWAVPKDPDEVLDYQFDWGQFRLEEGETIVTSTFIIIGSVEIDNETIDGGFTTFWASGGTAGEACKITNRVVTSEGRTYDQTCTLRVRAR